MEALELARWQFGITTVYHFILVPLTIGLSVLVAIMQTVWVRTGNEKWLRLTKFFGKLLLINFALGVATGIVQEFQFGMSWSNYSRFVGDVFGAPLAMEALLAFFLESTFLGLWIFGWDRLPKKVHLMTVWAFAIGSTVSAYFILAANSFMQHPVGVDYDAEKARATMTSIVDVLTNPTTLVTFPHVIASAFVVAGTFVAGISAYWLVKKARADKNDPDISMYRTATKFGAWVLIISGIAAIYTGDLQAKLMFKQQPLKMAAAEALIYTEQPAGFSILAIGNLDGNDPSSVKQIITIPGLLSFLATGDWNAEVPGLTETQQMYADRYGGEPSDYQPNLMVTYWTFRGMIGFAAIPALFALAALWLTRGNRAPDKLWFSRLAIIALPMPYIAASLGWIFTEMGRQPFVVAPNLTGSDQVFLLTQSGVSPAVSAGEIFTSLTVFTVLYAILGVFWFLLTKRYAMEGAPVIEHEPEPASEDADKPLSFAY